MLGYLLSTAIAVFPTSFAEFAGLEVAGSFLTPADEKF